MDRRVWTFEVSKDEDGCLIDELMSERRDFLNPYVQGHPQMRNKGSDFMKEDRETLELFLPGFHCFGHHVYDLV